jgi:hypothetical protein
VPPPPADDADAELPPEPVDAELLADPLEQAVKATAMVPTASRAAPMVLALRDLCTVIPL